jgi:hypothetical protein
MSPLRGWLKAKMRWFVPPLSENCSYDINTGGTARFSRTLKPCLDAKQLVS